MAMNVGNSSGEDEVMMAALDAGRRDGRLIGINARARGPRDAGDSCQEVVR